MLLRRKSPLPPVFSGIQGAGIAVSAGKKLFLSSYVTENPKSRVFIQNNEKRCAGCTKSYADFVSIKNGARGSVFCETSLKLN